MSKITAQMLKAAKAELRRREERAALKADCEKDLMAFVEAFWPVVEPATPLIKGWVLEAMCDVLMAASDGHLHRICINVPPGSMKSTMLNVFYPAWLWGAQNKPHLRFISASYSTMIPERDNGRLLRVIQSDLFRQFWGDRVQVVREGVGLVETSATGWKRVVSTGGGTTGHRGDYVLCLERSARILTNQGEMAVGDIVDERREILVAGWSGNGVRWQRIECYEINPPGRMVRISYAGRSLVCTIDHPIWIEGRGFVRADHVRPGDVLKGMPHLLGARDGLAEVLQPGLLREASGAEARCGYRAVCGLRDRLLQVACAYRASRNRGNVQPGVLALEQQRGEQPQVCWRERPGNLPPLWQGHPAQSVRGKAGHCLFKIMCPKNELGGSPQSADAQAMSGLRGVLCSMEQGIKALLAEVRGSSPRQEDGWQREWSLRRWARGTPDRMGDGATERPGASLRSLWGGVSAKIQNVAVLRTVLSACRAWGESLRAKEWALGPWSGELWIPAGMDGSVSRIHPPARREPVSALQYDRGPAREGVAGASHRLSEGKSRHIEPDHGLPLLSWADARAPGGPGEVEGVVVRSVEFIGETGEPTYNLRVGPDHNYFVEGVLAHNCDDLNDPNNVESETIRAGTSHWLREVMPDRVNNLKTSVIINIQQRTHEQDATGVLLQFGYTHISIPMEFDPGRFQHVVLRRNKAGEATQVWADPRGLDKDGNELEGLVVRAHGGMEAAPGSPMARAEGTLCWPERYPEDEMEKMKTIKGPYAWACNTGEAPILMADLSMKPLSEIRVGDAIVGFEASCDPRRDGEKFGRRRLMKTTVEDVHVSVRPVVKITLDSGRVIRCTPDHKWYTGRTPNDKSHPVYAAAKLKRALIRVCEPSLPDITDVETARMAGWLSGFYEGEGTVVFQSRRPGYAKNAIISFYQGCEDNLPICDELERVLAHFGFEYGISERKRAKSHWQKARMYWLKRGGLPLLQRFLHIVRPIKWRERIVEAAFASNFVRGEERVVSIEPDGEDVVYGLTTGTANYVVWGLASSNSQYQQLPTVRGGAIIRREWWRRWRGMVLPEFGTVIASLDTAIKEGTENDFNALTILGAFADDEGAPQFMLADAWRVRTNLADLVRMVADACRKHNVDYLLIEDKARGHDVAAEIRRLYASSPWDTLLLKIGGGRYAQDKVTRVMAITPMFSGPVRKDPATGLDIWDGGMFWAPEADWAEEVISETTSFPRGAHDDYCDCLAQAALWARKTGLAITKAEYREAEDDAMQYQRPVGVPYAIHGPVDA